MNEHPVLVSEAITRSAGPRRGPHTTYSIVANWHAEQGHVGRFDHCPHQPCHAIHYTRH